MVFQDKKLNCKDCHQEFVWSTGEQKFFAEKGFEREPVRCPDCRKKKKSRVNEGGHQSHSNNQEEMHQVKCKKCAKISEVPFLPRDPENILCSNCFEESFGSNQAK